MCSGAHLCMKECRGKKRMAVAVLIDLFLPYSHSEGLPLNLELIRLTASPTDLPVITNNSEFKDMGVET